MVLPETARRDPRRGEIPVMRISCPLLSDFPAAGARRKHTAEVITSPSHADCKVRDHRVSKNTRPIQGGSLPFLPGFYHSAHQFGVLFYQPEKEIPVNSSRGDFQTLFTHRGPDNEETYKHPALSGTRALKRKKPGFCTRKHTKNERW